MLGKNMFLHIHLEKKRTHTQAYLRKGEKERKDELENANDQES